MGLAEKRAIKQYREANEATRLQEIRDAAGFDIPIEVAWDELAVDGLSHLYEEGLDKVVFGPIREAFRSLAADELGRAELKSRIERIHICNSGGKYGAGAFTLEGGVLTVDHDLVNIDHFDLRRDAICGLVYAADEGLSLKERRALEAYRRERFPAQKARVDAAAGFEVSMEIDWPSLCAPGYDHLYAEAWTAIFFDTLVQTFESICADDLGKEALQASLRKVVLRSSGGKYNATGLSFTDGVLDIDHEPVTNPQRIDERRDALIAILEEAL